MGRCLYSLLDQSLFAVDQKLAVQSRPDERLQFRESAKGP